MDNLLSLGNKVVLVTGASSGFGEHFSQMFARAGAKVVLAARRTDLLASIVRKIDSAGGTAMAVAMDVNDRASVKHAFDNMEAHYGLPNVVVCNAGISDPDHFLTMTEQQWDSVMAVNVKGVWNTGQEAAQRLVKAGQPGSIINIASILGFQVFPGFSNYSVSKAAVINLTKAMALDLTDSNIRVNAIAPGYFYTEMTAPYFESEEGKKNVAHLPQNRLGSMPEMDGQLLLLASDASSYTSGSIITIDAGHSTRLDIA